MKNLKQTFLTFTFLSVLSGLALVGCGDSDKPTHGDSPPAEESLTAGPQLQALVNGLSGVLTNLIREGGVAVTRIGEAIPKDIDPLDLTGAAERTVDFEKSMESTLGADLFRLEYQIRYEYGAKWKGRGQFVPNITFTPTHVKVDPFWSLKAEAVSSKPVNRGTAQDPIAEVHFAITFTAKGLGGTRIATDEFVLNAKTGELKSTIREMR